MLKEAIHKDAFYFKNNFADGIEISHLRTIWESS